MTEPPTASAPVRILLVDDRPSNLTSLQALLARPDYELVPAHSGPEALALVLQEEFAVILMDIGMPVMDGFEAAALLRQREKSRHIPIIFVTASVFDLEQNMARGYGVGAADYLTKPLSPEVVRSKVAVFVELYRQRRLIEEQSARLREIEAKARRVLREQAEDALKESAALYQLTFEEAPVGIGSATPEGRWAKANRCLLEVLGLDQPGALIGRPVEEMVAPSERAQLRAGLQQLREGGLGYCTEHRLASAGGSPRWAAVTLAPLRNPPEAAPRQVIVVVNDVSDRRQLEQERAELVQRLEAGIRSRDEFLSIVAHELKTPLTPLRLQTASLLHQVAKRPGQVSPGVLRQVGAIDRAASRLDALINRLLDFTGLIAGQLTLEREEVELSALAQLAADRLEADAARAGSPIRVRASGRVVGRWDPGRLGQAVSHLLANAIKFGSGQPIDLEIGADDSIARVVVRDRGIGVPVEEQEQIFAQFGKAAPLRHFGGFGLGLWTVRRIVESHGGSVGVVSRPGEGSEFIIELPLAQPAPNELRAVQ